MSLFLFVVAAVLFATGGLFMKLSDGLTRWQPSVGVFLFFGAGAACQAIGMRRQDMGAAYTLVLGLEAIAAMTLGVVAAGDRITLGKIGAIAMILGGIVLLERA